MTRRWRWQRALALGLATIIALAVLAGHLLNFEVEPQMQRHNSIFLHATHNPRHSYGQKVTGSTPALTTPTACILNGKEIAGCRGTTMMDGQTCTFTVDMITREIKMHCNG